MIRIAYNLDDTNGSTIVASSTYNSDFPGRNVILNQIGRPWRSSTPIATPETVAFDMGSAKSKNMAAIFGHNFSASAVVKLQRSPDNSAWTDVGTFTIATDADSNVLPRCVLYFSAISYRYWRIHITDASNADGYINIGRIVIETYYEPDRNFTDDYSIDLVDPSEQQRTSGAEPIFRQLDVYRRAVVKFDFADDTQRRKFMTIFYKVKTVKPMVISLDPTNASANTIVEETLYCSFVTPMRLITALVNQHTITGIVFEERVSGL